jgi:hypothetical protein
MTSKRLLVNALSLALLQGAWAPTAYADADFQRYANSGYTYCDAVILGGYWGQSADSAKATVGRKLGWGNARIVADNIAMARRQGWRCEFHETGLTYDDAEAVASLWGVGVDDAKAALAEKVSMGMLGLALQVVAEAHGG